MIASISVTVAMSYYLLWVKPNKHDPQAAAITARNEPQYGPSDLQAVITTPTVIQPNSSLDISATVNKDGTESSVELEDAEAKDGCPELIMGTERVSTDWEVAMGLEATQPVTKRFSWEPPPF